MWRQRGGTSEVCSDINQDNLEARIVKTGLPNLDPKDLPLGSGAQSIRMRRHLSQVNQQKAVNRSGKTGSVVDLEDQD